MYVLFCFTLKFEILYYYPPHPPPTSANRAGFVATDKLKAPLFLYFSVLQGWRFKMTGAYTKSAFAVRHYFNIYAQIHDV